MRNCCQDKSILKSPERETHGFTLVELLAVIAIIALLAGLLMGISGYASRKAYVSSAQADLEKIKVALEEYRVVYGEYPPNANSYDTKVLSAALWVKPQAENRRPFLVLKGWNSESTQYEILDPWGREYGYLQPGSRNEGRFRYDLWSRGPDADNEESWITNWKSE